MIRPRLYEGLFGTKKNKKKLNNSKPALRIIGT